MSVSSTSNTPTSSSCAASPSSQLDNDSFDVKLIHSSTPDETTPRRGHEEAHETSVGNLKQLALQREPFDDKRAPVAGATVRVSTTSSNSTRLDHVKKECDDEHGGSAGQLKRKLESTVDGPTASNKQSSGASREERECTAKTTTGRHINMIQRSSNVILKTRPLLISHNSSSQATVVAANKKPPPCAKNPPTAVSFQTVLSSTTTQQANKSVCVSSKGVATDAKADVKPKLGSNMAAPSNPTPTDIAGFEQSKRKAETNNDQRQKSPASVTDKSEVKQQSSLVSPAGTAAAAKLIDLGKRLLEATRQNQVEVVKQLVVHSGAPFTTDWLGTTALHLAAQNGSLEICEILLKGGVNRDARTKLERTALHLAAQKGSLEVVDLLIKRGADVNARDMLKMTPLHWAAERGHLLVLQRLLMAGADLTLRSKFQLTPVDIARNSADVDATELLEHWELESMVRTRCEVGLKGEPDEGAHTSQGAQPRMQSQSNHDHYPHLAGNNFTSEQSPPSSESHDMLDFDFHMSLMESGHQQATIAARTTSRHAGNNATKATLADMDEPCVDLIEFDLDQFEFEPDLFLTSVSSVPQPEPRVEYLKKVVEELKRENRHLKQRVEQLSTTRTINQTR